jgi:hypothetical protein
MIEGIDHVNLVVEERDESRRFGTGTKFFVPAGRVSHWS